jgi:general secretion pathway protein H
MTPILGFRAGSTRGFTLLELLLVLTIMAMASILVVPNIGSLDSRTFNVQIREATSLLNYARRIAVVSGQPSTAIFSSGQARSDQDSNNGSSRSNVRRWESDGTTVRYRDSTDREIEVEEQIEIIFYPEGGSTGGTLLLSQEERVVSITVDPFTGRISTQYEEN